VCPYRHQLAVCGEVDETWCGLPEALGQSDESRINDSLLSRQLRCAGCGCWLAVAESRKVKTCLTGAKADIKRDSSSVDLILLVKNA
jgi:hypothetical protein